LSASRRPAFEIISHGPEQTRAIGALVGRLLARGSVVLLHGELGSGKTTFVQGLARPLRIDDRVQSPTFTIVAEHQGAGADGTLLRLYHIDLFRLETAAAVESFGLEEYLSDPDAIAVIEWPERARWAMPEEYLLVELTHMADEKRNLRLVPRGECYAELIRRFRKEASGGRR
jgi:tRNA threonylcarbamoyladenosine biosynthesis protein TsaE